MKNLVCLCLRHVRHKVVAYFEECVPHSLGTDRRIGNTTNASLGIQEADLTCAILNMKVHILCLVFYTNIDFLLNIFKLMNLSF